MNDIDVDAILNKKRVWLYSARFGNMWWCYDTHSSEKLDIIYNDFVKRNKQTDDAHSADIKVINDSEIVVDVPITNGTFDYVMYEDSIKSQDENLTQSISYNLLIDGNEFTVDFHHWRQSNSQHPNRIRYIKTITVPHEITNGVNLVNFLINNNVKGFSGDVWVGKN